MSRPPYDTFRETLATRYPDYGYALWVPNPGGLYDAVEVGDVGFIREGYFHRLFNALLPENDPSNQRIGVPENYQPLSPRLSDHIRREVDGTEDFYSRYVSLVSHENDARVGPDDLEEIKFSSPGKRGAMLSLPFPAQREDTVARVDFKSWIVKHIDRWVAFAESHGFEINGMQDIILVTGRHCAKSWINVAFSDSLQSAEVSIGVRTTGVSNVDLERRSVRGDMVVKLGPRGNDLPENQCIFIRGFRVFRIVKKWPRLVGQAGSASSPGPHEPELEPEVEAIGDYTNPNSQDPLHVLLQYIAERAPDCDMAVVHDDNLACIDSIFLDNPQPSALIEHLRNSTLSIRQAQYNSLSSNETGAGGVVFAEIATLSKEESPPVDILSNISTIDERIQIEHPHDEMAGPSRRIQRSSRPMSLEVPPGLGGLYHQYEQGVAGEEQQHTVDVVLEKHIRRPGAQPLQQEAGFSSFHRESNAQLHDSQATSHLSHDAMSLDPSSEQRSGNMLWPVIALQDVQQVSKPGGVLDFENGNKGSRKQNNCDVCGKRFGRLQELRRHIKDKHEPPRACPFCDFTWTRPGRMRTHLQTCHNERLTKEDVEELRNLQGWHPTAHFIEKWDSN